jgi:hypothetical protein
MVGHKNVAFSLENKSASFKKYENEHYSEILLLCYTYLGNLCTWASTGRTTFP